MLLYEAGEALRFDEVSIRAGVKGIISVMRHLDMLPKSRARRQKTHEPFVARSSIWVRASASGLFRKVCTLGARVKRGELLGLIDDPFGGEEFEVTASASGIVIGCSQIPLVHEGEALFHIARFEDVRGVAGQVESFQTEFTPEEIQGNARQEEPPIV
jgi:predicted deacylase